LLGREEHLQKALEVYRMHVYQQGHEGNETRLPDGKTLRGALSHESVLAVLTAKGRLPLSEYLKCRVRYFCDGAVFGSREFVDGIFFAYRGSFGAKRKDGARRLRGVQEKLYALRDLKTGLFG